MTIKYGAIIYEGQEHATTAASFFAWLSFIESWIDNVTGVHALGIVLNQFQWAAQEYTLKDMDEATVSFHSYAKEYERHFPIPQMRDIIARCRELRDTPLSEGDDGVLFIISDEKFVVMTLKSLDSDMSLHAPTSTVFGFQEKTNDN